MVPTRVPSILTRSVAPTVRGADPTWRMIRARTHFSPAAKACTNSLYMLPIP